MLIGERLLCMYFSLILCDMLSVQFTELMWIKILRYFQYFWMNSQCINEQFYTTYYIDARWQIRFKVSSMKFFYCEWCPCIFVHWEIRMVNPRVRLKQVWVVWKSYVNDSKVEKRAWFVNCNAILFENKLESYWNVFYIDQ